ncbi:MAG: DNA-directed RNA polymerase subunit omega [Cetobacterium sp.]|uniref:DNA-directed RNA polymerase subunit omega n=1 Tax=Cetobacterium sp. TaxID=2071632 RepID=UPI003F2C4DCC
MKKMITYDELLDVIPNKYILTITAGKRARDLGKGAVVLTKTSKKDSVIRKTFKEILDKKITFADIEEEIIND